MQNPTLSSKIDFQSLKTLFEKDSCLGGQTCRLYNEIAFFMLCVVLCVLCVNQIERNSSSKFIISSIISTKGETEHKNIQLCSIRYIQNLSNEN